MGVTKEQFSQLCIDAQFVTNDQGNARCPITGDQINRENCRREGSKRLLRGNACELLCEPLLDDLKIGRFGGITSVNSDAVIPVELLISKKNSQ